MAWNRYPSLVLAQIFGKSYARESPKFFARPTIQDYFVWNSVWYSYLWDWGSCPWAVSYSRNCEGCRTFRPRGPLGSGIWWVIGRPHSDPHLGLGFWQDAAGVRCTLCTSGFCFGLQILTGFYFVWMLFVMCWLFCHDWWCDFCDVECWNERWNLFLMVNTLSFSEPWNNSSKFMLIFCQMRRFYFGSRVGDFVCHFYWACLH